MAYEEVPKEENFYYGENFIINLDEKRILYINEDADIEIPDYVDPISCGDIEPINYNGHTYNAYCYNKDFKNDCMAFAEYITKGCLDTHKWEGECHLCEIKTKDVIGDTDKENIRIAKLIKEKYYKKYEGNAKAGKSIAIIETSNKIFNLKPGEKMVPYHVAHIMFIDKQPITSSSSGITENLDTIITIEADAGDDGRETPVFEVYLKNKIPTAMKQIGFNSNITTFVKAYPYFVKPQIVLLESYTE